MPNTIELRSRITYSTVASSTVLATLMGSFYGGVWGSVTPFHPPGSPAAIAEHKTGIFRAARPFSSLKSVYCNAAVFGPIAGVQQLSSKTLAYFRQQDDYINDLVGFGAAYKYFTYFLASSDERLIRHNRVFGAAVLGAIAYGHIAE